MLNYIAESAHNGLELSCKAQNQMIKYDYVKDSVRIIVHCKPNTEWKFNDISVTFYVKWIFLRIQTRDLYVSVRPKVAISFGRSINAYAIKEGDDVYFECRILSYPPARKVTWMQNVSESVLPTIPDFTNWIFLFFQNDVIKPSRHHGVLISNLSLVIQNVRLADAGMYSCVAENAVGEGESNKIELKIKCELFSVFPNYIEYF